MTRARRESLLTVIVWAAVTIGFAWSVFGGGGPAAYAAEPGRRVIGAVFLAIGLFGTPILRTVLRKQRPREGVDYDERDERMQKTATTAGLVVVMMAVFLAAIWLWEAYQEPGCVPVGWMWIVAYGALVLSHLVPPAVFLFLDLRGLESGQG